MNETKVVYTYDANGIYIYEKILDSTDKSPVSVTWQIPAGCTEVAPMEKQDGYNRVFLDRKWTLVEIPVEPIVLPTLDELKEAKINQAGQLFATIRDAIRWVECSTGKYGFDCATEDIVNFMSAYTPMLVVGKGTVMYKVWFDTLNKVLVELSYDDMTKVYSAVRQGQIDAYIWYETIKAQINACKTVEGLAAIKVEA